jgi:hypothetical protein
MCGTLRRPPADLLIHSSILCLNETFLAIDLYFNIEKNFDCISGDILDVTDVLVDVYDITLSIDGEEMPQEMITEEVELWVENQIDWRDYEQRMIEKYLEDR